VGRETANHVLQKFFSYCPEIYTMKIEALCELTAEFLEKSSTMALKVNIDETASIHFFYSTAAIKPYQK